MHYMYNFLKFGIFFLYSYIYSHISAKISIVDFLGYIKILTPGSETKTEWPPSTESCLQTALSL